MKLHAHPVRTGQARRGRSIPRFAGLTALSRSNGLPGHARGEQNVSKGSSVHVAPLPPYPALAGGGTSRPKLLAPVRCVRFFDRLNFLEVAISLRWGNNLFRQRLLFVLD